MKIFKLELPKALLGSHRTHCNQMRCHYGKRISNLSALSTDVQADNPIHLTWPENNNQNRVTWFHFLIFHGNFFHCTPPLLNAKCVLIPRTEVEEQMRWAMEGAGSGCRARRWAGGAAVQQSAALPLHPSVRRDYSLREESEGGASSSAPSAAAIRGQKSFWNVLESSPGLNQF